MDPQTLDGIVFLVLNQKKNCLEMFLLYLTYEERLNVNNELKSLN